MYGHESSLAGRAGFDRCLYLYLYMCLLRWRREALAKLWGRGMLRAADGVERKKKEGERRALI